MNRDYFRQLLQKYRRRGVLLDTNILLAYFVGAYNPALLEQFKRTKDRFVQDDFETLQRVIRFFEKVVTTPNILTEVNSLSGQLPGGRNVEYWQRFARSVTVLDEHYLRSAEVVAQPTFADFGLTDMGILCLARAPYPVFTDDFRLANYLGTQGIDVLNFNHIRVLGWK